MRYTLILVSIVIFASCADVKSKHLCVCNVYGTATSGEIVAIREVTRKSGKEECEAIERELSPRYNNQYGTKILSCAYREEFE